MKKLPLGVKVAFASAAVVGLALFLLIVDAGAYAGRVHYGVTVAGFDVGGMTLEEAESALNDRRQLLRQEPICFESDAAGFHDCTNPIELGWFPDNLVTARRAFDVGRTDWPLAAIGHRIEAWAGGVNVRWDSGPRRILVDEVVARFNEQLAPGGPTISLNRFRAKLKRAIVTYPRDRTLRLPLEE